MASWRVARALETLLTQINEAAPNRSKSSDGSIGDASHQASKSDHNPNSAGVVQARDFTHDPRGGFDSYRFAEHLRTHPDKRVKYVISNRKIFAGYGGPQPWEWRSYSGSNPHDQHAHVSVEDSATLYDDGSPWQMGITVGLPDPSAPTITLPVLRVGSKGFYVSMLQTLLGMTGKAVDGIFGEGTKAALQQFQRDHKLDADGVCGVYSWRELMRPWAKETGILPTDPKAKLTEMAMVAQQTGSTASVDELVAAFVVVLEDILPPGFVLTADVPPVPVDGEDWLPPPLPDPDPDRTEYHAVVDGGYYSDDPLNKKNPTAIRCNNPGAINTTSHIASLPGYNTAYETSKGNRTAVFWAPEYGVLAYHDLLKRYRDAGAVTIRQIIKRYGGGQDYSAYEKFVCEYTGLHANYEIKIDGSDDDELLSFAHAMFRYEAGKETPLSDLQITTGFGLARERERMA
jgi:peptidoglycan hydrolase-like protein with peptidoglycan-binding domain